MDAIDFDSMSSDELWKLHEEVTAQLADKLAAEKAELMDRERRLRKVLESLGTSDSHARPESLP
jgi:DNA-binding protein H-NS